MRIVLLCGPPCSGKTTLANLMATGDDVVLDYDTIARTLGSPTPWNHPEPWRGMAEQQMQEAIAQASSAHLAGTAWVIRTAPRATQRARLAAQWQATVYLLNPGEQECLRRALADERPSGTRRSIGEWYHRYRPWEGDRNPAELDARWVNVSLVRLSVDPTMI